ncbi:MAG: response regulator [Anaerolineaceae bacterium]|jgi:two-component system chemotaxis response regulator CheY|nr:response regulator [Anaerolineae bacterium]MDX9831938.1 response regulator [Anaerolineae bacterium]NLF15051.1 response regulator [Anaerolineaceae bacterium]
MAVYSVLVIEHNWHLSKLIKANLQALGFEVREAVSKEHGLQRLEEGRPDLILLDLDLPAGLDFLSALRRRYTAEPVPVILIAGDPPNRHLLQQAEVRGHLLKPFGVPGLLEQVERLLGALPNA